VDVAREREVGHDLAGDLVVTGDADDGLRAGGRDGAVVLEELAAGDATGADGDVGLGAR
jgi:hypothetical protein